MSAETARGEATALDLALADASAPKDTRTVLDLIKGMEPEIAKSLQSDQGAAILVRHYYNAIRYSEGLRQCTAESLVAALLLSAQVRLEPGPLGHVYLVPFKDGKANVFNVVWMLGYTGIIELGRRGGAQALRATVVHEDDAYVEPWENEKGAHWEHRPASGVDRGERRGVLVTWREGTERMALHCPPERVDVAIKASRNPRASELRNEDWYWRKTGVRFARPWLPLNTDNFIAPFEPTAAVQFSRAIAADGGVARGLDVDTTGAALPVVDGESE